jgi:RNA polymerase sigma-70 factor (ECF subfamily)
MADVDGYLQSLLLELPFAQRAAVVMRHVLDLSYEEIAAALDRPVGTIKSDVNRGLARLRQAYPQEVAR